MTNTTNTTSNIVSPEEMDPDPDEQREMSHLGQGVCWFGPAFGHKHSLKPLDPKVLWLHNVEWHAKFHSDPDCQAIFEISGGFTILLPVRTDAAMITVGACCPRCGELLPAGDLRAGVRFVRLTRDAFLATNDVHPSPAATQ